jgi:hypothetical protein
MEVLASKKTDFPLSYTDELKRLKVTRMGWESGKRMSRGPVYRKNLGR